mmetsp:Transcript_42276/g.80802  ORF Transcript_42276/g.80802 Transcript_42276/m.80802 type:complete len:236 (-) Transcript_42276:58-765(-)
MHESVSNVLHDLEAHFARRVGDLVQRHAVHLDGVGVFFLLKVDVPHVHAQPPAARKLLIFYDGSVRVQRLSVQLVLVVLVRQVEAHRVCQIDVDLVRQLALLSLLAQGPLPLARVLGAFQRPRKLPLRMQNRALLQQLVHLPFELLARLLRRRLRTLLQRGSRPAHGVLIERIELPSAFWRPGGVSCCFHRGHWPSLPISSGTSTRCHRHHTGAHPRCWSQGGCHGWSATRHHHP